MVEARQITESIADLYTGPISAVLFLSAEFLVAASGRTLMLFNLNNNELKTRHVSCIPAGMKINNLEHFYSPGQNGVPSDGDQNRPISFIVQTERTFAVYAISDTLDFYLSYYHGAQALD